MVLAIFAALPAIAAIFGVFKYWSSIVLWLSKKTIAQKEQNIDQSVNSEKHDVEDGSRPKWD